MPLLSRAFAPVTPTALRLPLVATLAPTTCRVALPASQGQLLRFRHYIRSAKTRDTTPQGLIFTHDDVPPLHRWEQSNLMPHDLTAKDCYNTAGWFCQTARASESTWKGKLVRDYGIDPYMLHWTGIQLLNHPVKNTKLAALMLKTATDFDYAPSVVAFIRAFAESWEEPKTHRSREFLHPIRAKFKSLVKQGQDPDALTLKARICLSRDNDSAAMGYLNRAIKAAESSGAPFAPAPTKQDALGLKVAGPLTGLQREAKWSSEVECHYQRGCILVRRGDVAAAEAAFRVAAYELDDAEAYLALAKVLPRDSPERRSCLVKAAMSGNRDAFPLLCAYETDELRDLAEKKRGGGPLWAAEWARVWKDAQVDANVFPTKPTP